MIANSGIANSMWVSEPIHIGCFFKEYLEKISPAVKALNKSGVDNYDLQTMSSVMGTSQTLDEFHQLITYCAEDKLDVPDEPPSLNVQFVSARHRLFERGKIPDSSTCGLTSLKHLRNMVKEREASRNLKYGKRITINNSENDKCNLKVKKDFVVTIRIHDTIFPNETDERRHAPTKPFSQEIVVLGSQTLADVRDMIVCSTDHTTTFEESEKLVFRTKETVQEDAKDVFRSGFIFIEDTFYNDFRSPSNIDYSKVIRNWAEGKRIGPLNSCSITERKIEELTVRFGYPYVYQHQGNCEHLVVFADASLLHESDVCDKQKYPLLSAFCGKKPKECMICCLYAARWITFENERVPVDPFYFCDHCLKSYNFIDEKKIGKFKLYQFHPFVPFSLD